MLSAPPDEAWNAVRTRILADIDNLSGWSRAFQKELAERHQVWIGKNGNYYQKEPGGTIYRVMGAKTIEETWLDFLTRGLAEADRR